MTQSAKSAAFACILLALTACTDDPKPKAIAPTKLPSAERLMAPETTEAAALTSTATGTPRSILDPLSSPTRPKQPPEAPNSEAPTKLDEELETKVVTNDEVHASEVRVDRFLLTSGIDDREPIDEGDTFTTDNEGIYAFAQLANETDEPTEVFVHFERESDPALTYGIALQVPTAKRWRTWAVTRIKREPGAYRAVLRSAEGKDLATKSFEIIASD